MDAIFYRQRKNKNIFHVLTDDLTELKGNMAKHEKQTTAKLESFGRTIEDMGFAIGNHQ